MKIYYWEDPAGLGWDIVAHADSEIAAKSIAKEKIDLETLSPESAKIREAIELSRPTGIYHYAAALCIFTEGDPVESRIGLQALNEAREALRRAEVKLSAYVGVCKDDKELTNTVLPMVSAALAKLAFSLPSDKS